MRRSADSKPYFRCRRWGELVEKAHHAWGSSITDAKKLQACVTAFTKSKHYSDEECACAKFGSHARQIARFYIAAFTLEPLAFRMQVTESGQDTKKVLLTLMRQAYVCSFV